MPIEINVENIFSFFQNNMNIIFPQIKAWSQNERYILMSATILTYTRE